MRLYWKSKIWFKGVNLYFEEPYMIDLKAGDELVIFRRRSSTVKDPTTGEDVVKQDMKELSVVQLQGDDRQVIGGSVEDRWIDDKRYIEIRLETRK